jgi:hypothetical protein
MIIECANCESKVDANVKGHYDYVTPEDHETIRALLLICPVCKEPMLGCQDQYQNGPDSFQWSNTKRLWPAPDKYISWNIPDIVRVSLEEAHICLKSKAYNACAVMCGRALEGVCSKYGTKTNILAKGLKELLDKGVIDNRLFQWSEELRKHRNIGAHATDEKITKEDARDLLDFVNAICEYVFVLKDKYDKFLKRKKK